MLIESAVGGNHQSIILGASFTPFTVQTPVRKPLHNLGRVIVAWVQLCAKSVKLITIE